MTEVKLGTEKERAELIAICESASVPERYWFNRDSHAAQKQMGECWALLKAGCDFRIRRKSAGDSCISTPKTLWVDTWAEGFAHHDWGGARDNETFYLPTRKRLAEVGGKDWY